MFSNLRHSTFNGTYFAYSVYTALTHTVFIRDVALLPASPQSVVSSLEREVHAPHFLNGMKTPLLNEPMCPWIVGRQHKLRSCCRSSIGIKAHLETFTELDLLELGPSIVAHIQPSEEVCSDSFLWF